jgi:mannobiose 2-epimerase
MSTSLVSSNSNITQSLAAYKSEIIYELAGILDYWERNSVDTGQGGFYGAVDINNVPNLRADKSLILNSRILWTFSAAHHFNPKPGYRKLADRAFNYLNTFFWDTKNAGAYWSVKANGAPSDRNKQVYGEGFLIYAFSEYYKISGNLEALDKAKNLYQTLQIKCKDLKNGGYYEAFNADWEAIEDKAITQGKAGRRKSMNTHLHLIEAFANLYQVYPDAELRAEIERMLSLFHEKIIPNGRTQILFFSDDWSSKGEAVSFGHDIESAWLLLETSKTIKSPIWSNKMQVLAVNMAIEAAKGVDPEDGGMWHESTAGVLNTQKHWWPQAEAMVGFYNAYQLTGDQRFLQLSLNSWSFIKNKLKSPTGEWIWGIDEQEKSMTREGKIGPWKGPYHNSRACMEILKRLG